MKRSLYTILLVAFSLLYTSTAYALSVNSVRFGVHPDKTRIVVETNQPTDFRAFTLDNPHRLVIDLPKYEWRAGIVNKPAGSSILDLRTGVLDSLTSRLVVDLSQPIAIQSAFTLPKTATAPDRLVIDFVVIPSAQVSAAKEKRFGALERQKPPKANFNTKKIQQNARQTEVIIESSAGIILPPRKPTILNSNANINNAIIKAPLVKRHIVIDAGHGGQDPGAVSKNNVYEKRVTLAAAKILKEKLERTGRYKVTLTRDNDRYIKLHHRVNIARKENADMFISLHADSIGDRNVRGASVYTLSNKASDSQTAKLAARENRADLIAGVDLTHEDKEVADILIDLAMRDTMNQSKFFANTIVSTLPNHGIKVLRRPHRYAGFAVLKAPDIPSVLVEMGFMSNYQDVSLLSSDRYRRKMASALADSIDKYFEKVHKNQNL